MDKGGALKLWLGGRLLPLPSSPTLRGEEGGEIESGSMVLLLLVEAVVMHLWWKALAPASSAII